jgi:hypothetical protein
VRVRGRSDFDEVAGCERAKRQRSERSADIERAEVDREIAGLFDKLADLGFRSGVVARLEQDALAARDPRLWQGVGVKMVERLDDARARNERAEYLA